MNENERRDYERERLVAWAMEAISQLMEVHSVSKADVARQLGCSRAHVTQLLSGSRNVTLRSLSDLAWACGGRVSIESQPLHERGYVSHPMGYKFLAKPRVVETDSGWTTPASNDGACDVDLMAALA